MAYFGSDGGGVWKTTNCCTAATTWAVKTDLPQLSTISIDDLALDPQNHSTIYAATGDLTFGSFSFGSAGVLKSTDSGATWTVKGASAFGPPYPPALTSFPQYQAVGKVRVDPNNSSNVVVGTKTGVYFSYDGGDSWSPACLTNTFSSQRQDITGLILRDDGATTTVIAAVGTRGYGTAVQPNLGNNGANGIYSTAMPASGCPAVASWTLISTPANGWPANTGSGTPCAMVIPPADDNTVCPAGANVVGRIDLAIAPSDKNVMYAEVQSINPQTPCGALQVLGETTKHGCFLGLWRTTNGGTTWTQRADHTALGNNPACGEDTNQNWYNQALAVDPTNPDVVMVDILDIWKSSDGGQTLTDVTCGYQLGLAFDPVHVDQHALAYVPGDDNTLLAGNDGGMWISNNAASAAQQPTALLPGIPTFTQANTTVSTIEFYSGDITKNFATAPTATAAAGAQDNGSSNFTWTNPPGPGVTPAMWSQRTGGDGVGSRIEPNVGNRYYTEVPYGTMFISTTGPTGPYHEPTLEELTDPPWVNDRPSFVFPYEIDKHYCGGVPLSNNTTPCDHMIAGAAHVWETVTGGLDGTGVPVVEAWHRTSPTDLTKGTLADRSFINQLSYAWLTNTIAIAGTNDGNVQFGFNLGNATPDTAAWVNVTGGNATLPNRPILDVTIAPNNNLTGYAAVGGFDENTLGTPGHVFQVTCTASCASFLWADKTGNLPNIPVDSIIANPHVPNQVFAGTDFGLYFTNDITAGSPTWFRFENGLPHAMIWDLTVDRGDTTLAVFTRSRGAYAWPLPTAGLPTAVRLASFTASPTRAGVVVRWRTAVETGTLGYNVWRYRNGRAIKLNRALIPAKTSGIGSAGYRFADRTARGGLAYTYRLQAVGQDGGRAFQASAAVRAR